MAVKKRKGIIEYRIYEIPQGRHTVILYGEEWKRVYGHEYEGLHFHNLMEIGICRYGNGELRMSDSTEIYEAGTITVFPEYFRHATYSYGEEKNHWEYVFLDPRMIFQELFPDDPLYVEKLMRLVNSRHYILKERDYPQLKRMIDLLIREEEEKKPFYPRIIQDTLHVFALELLRELDNLPEYEEEKGEAAEQLSGIFEFIKENLQQPLKVKALADRCNLSETHFRRLFTDMVDMSPMDYVNLVRIRYACDRMRQGNGSMEQIAQECGFANISTFNRNFRKYLGMSPYQWKTDPANGDGSTAKFLILPKKGW